MDPIPSRQLASNLRSKLRNDARWQRYLEGAAAVHLAVLVEPFLSLILEGKKTIESRFAQRRTAPYGQVSRGDILILKRAAGPIVGLALAADCSYVSLSTETWPHVKALAAQLCADDQFWQTRSECRYASLIELAAVRTMDPLNVEKRDRRPWVVLTNPSKQVSWTS